MKKYLLVTVLSLLFIRAECLCVEPLANENKAGLYVRSIEQVLRLAPDEIDLATAALIISEEWSELVHGRRYLTDLDDMTYEIRSRNEEQGFAGTYGMVKVINEYLFDELGYSPLAEAHSTDDLFLHRVMDKRKGYCLTLSILYLSLGERLGLPLYGVVVPGHFFVRYDDGRVRFNIETTSKGGTASDEHYIKKFKVDEVSEDSIYMKNLGKKQVLGCFLNNLGNTYIEVGDIDQALLALEQAVEINPTLAESRSNLGNIYLKNGRITDAIYEYRSALDVYPNASKTHNNLGNAYLKQDWLDDAISEYRHSLRLDPNSIMGYKNLAIAYSKIEKYETAQSVLRNAISIKPTDSTLYRQIGDVYVMAGDYQKALSEYRKALGINRNFAEAHFGIGNCYNKLGEPEQAISAYEKALSEKPDMADASTSLGNVYFGKGDYSEAIEQYKKAVHIKPANEDLHYNLGSAYYNKGDYEKAAEAYSRAIKIEPKMPDGHKGLGLVYYNLKKYDLAWKHITIAEELGAEVPKELLAAVEDKLQ